MEALRKLRVEESEYSPHFLASTGSDFLPLQSAIITPAPMSPRTSPLSLSAAPSTLRSCSLLSRLRPSLPSSLTNRRMAPIPSDGSAPSLSRAQPATLPPSSRTAPRLSSSPRGTRVLERSCSAGSECPLATSCRISPSKYWESISPTRPSRLSTRSLLRSTSQRALVNPAA